jgi:hypothetical protein
MEENVHEIGKNGKDYMKTKKKSLIEQRQTWKFG